MLHAVYSLITIALIAAVLFGIFPGWSLIVWPVACLIAWIAMRNPPRKEVEEVCETCGQPIGNACQFCIHRSV